MPNTNNSLLIGTMLKDAGLVNQKQIQKALDSQRKFPKMKLGEILAVQNRIKSETIDFFIYKWTEVRQKGYQFPLGYYFQQASLLSNEQIQTVLTEQKENSLKFGDIAVAKKWLNSKTISFFLDNISANLPQLVSLDALEQYNQDQLHLERKYADPSMILTRIIAWTGGNPSLSSSICQVFTDSDFNIPQGKEYLAVDQLIENDLINNWSTSKLGNYLRDIVESLDSSQRYPSLKLWQEYREVLVKDDKKYGNKGEQDELLNLGLIIKEGNNLKVPNLIFNQAFNVDFVAKKINEKQLQEKQKKAKINNKPTEKKQYLDNSKANTQSNVEPRKSNFMPKIKSDIEQKNISKITSKKSWMIIPGLILLIPLFLMASKYLSPTKEVNQPIASQTDDPNTLQNFCEGINISDTESRLNSIFKLEQKKQELLKNNLNNSSIFPDLCEAALNEMRMLSAPDLGKENKTLYAIRNLCKIPADSEFLTEAKAWLDHWYHSPAWGRETKFYLKDASDCPAAKELIEKSAHDDH